MILVTGATGTVGSHVVRELRGADEEVRGFVRDQAKAAAMFGDAIEFAIGDFSDHESVRRAVDGVDALFLACGDDPRKVEFESGVLDAAEAAGVSRIVKLSAAGAEIGGPFLWDLHGRIEQRLQTSGIPAAILQPIWFMSNVLAAADPVRSQDMLFAPANAAKIAMIDPADVAAVAAVMLTAGGYEGHSYVLTSNEAITYADVARELSAVTGRDIRFVDIPDDAAREGLVQAGMPELFAGGVVELFGRLRQGAGEQVTDTVRVVTGREPRSLGEFLREHAAAFGG